MSAPAEAEVTRGYTAPIAIGLTPDEIDFLIEALDSHEYWQLSDSDERNNGASLIEDDENPEVDFGRAIAHRLAEAKEGRATPPAVRPPERDEDEDEDDEDGYLESPEEP